MTTSAKPANDAGSNHATDIPLRHASPADQEPSQCRLERIARDQPQEIDAVATDLLFDFRLPFRERADVGLTGRRWLHHQSAAALEIDELRRATDLEGLLFTRDRLD